MYIFPSVWVDTVRLPLVPVVPVSAPVVTATFADQVNKSQEAVPPLSALYCISPHVAVPDVRLHTSIIPIGCAGVNEMALSTVIEP